MVSGQLPLRKIAPRIIAPRTIAPRIIATQTIFFGQLPPRKIALRIIAPQTITILMIASRLFLPGQLLPRNIVHRSFAPWINAPRLIDPENNCPDDNYRKSLRKNRKRVIVKHVILSYFLVGRQKEFLYQASLDKADVLKI